MRTIRSIPLLLLLFAFLRPEPVDACGYMAYSDHAGEPRPALDALLSGDRLPLLSPGWHSEYWVIAWARTKGKTFDAAERAAFGDDGSWLHLHASDGLRPALDAWASARQGHGARTAGRIDPWRRGPSYSHRLVCGPDAFLTAAETLTDRQRRQTPAELRAWIEAQDQVFARCADVNVQVPDPLPDTASQLARFDRDYQIAAATTYGEEPAAAEPLFAAIAQTRSPWADIARYRVGYLRVKRGLGTAEDLRDRLQQTRSGKARRGLVQLLDQVVLFAGRQPADIVEALSERLRTESIGGDLPRVLRDIVYFAKRVPPDSCVSGLVSLITGNEACRGEDTTLAELRGIGRVIPPIPSPPRLSGRLLEINRRFHAGRHALAEGRMAEARREAQALLAASRDSNAATRNAASALALATARNRAEVLQHVFRWQATTDPQGNTTGRVRGALHADGRAAVARLSMAQWRQLMGRAPDALEDQLAVEGLTRATILGEMDEARRFARGIVGSAADDADGLPQALRPLLRVSDDALRFGVTLALLEHDPGDLSISDELRHQWDHSQGSGCGFGSCGDDHPDQTPVSILDGAAELPISDERRQIERKGRRINAIGDLVLALAQAHPADPRTPEMLHRFVARTRRASLHYATDARTGVLSRRAFVLLHQRFPDDPWTGRTSYWYR